MPAIFVEGGNPLEGVIKPSGSRDSAVKLISSALFSNEDVILENIPRIQEVLLLIEIVIQLGGKVEWIGDNKIVINGSTMSSYSIPEESGVQSRFSTLLIPSLLFRFGKAFLPVSRVVGLKQAPINRWVDTWESLGMLVERNDNGLEIFANDLHSSTINFKISTHSGTANAILSSIFVNGETVINNAAEECEIDDMISFINEIGGHVERVEPRKIKVVGMNVFHGAYYEAQADNIEVITYASLALGTRGNITIKGIKGLQLASYINFLAKISSHYEYDKNELNVWYGGSEYTETRIDSSPAPGFLTDWLPFTALVLNFAQGKSFLHDTIYVDRFGYFLDLNRMGANIELRRPSEVGMPCVISDESYDFNNLGEPKTVLEINGPAKLKGVRLNMLDVKYDSVLIAAALCAEGRSEIVGLEGMSERYERYFDKLSSLGAHFSE